MSQDSYYEIAEQALPGGGLGSYALPEDVRFVIHRGVGSRIEDVEGKFVRTCPGLTRSQR